MVQECSMNLKTELLKNRADILSNIKDNPLDVTLQNITQKITYRIKTVVGYHFLSQPL